MVGNDDHLGLDGVAGGRRRTDAGWLSHYLLVPPYSGRTLIIYNNEVVWDFPTHTIHLSAIRQMVFFAHNVKAMIRMRHAKRPANPPAQNKASTYDPLFFDCI